MNPAMSDIPLIDRPEVKTRQRMVAEFLFTLLMWCGWLALFLPLPALVLWLLAEQHVSLSSVYPDRDVLARHLQEGVWVLFACFAIIPLWIGSNIIRFRRWNLRKQVPSPCASPEEWLAGYHRMSPALLRSLQQDKEVVWRDDMSEAVEVQVWLRGESEKTETVMSPPVSAEPSIRKSLCVAIMVIYLVAIGVMGIRLYEGMPPAG